MNCRFNQLKKKSFNGSFTVEAAFVIPIVLFVIFDLIYISFYFHDECVLRSVSDQVVTELCHVKETETSFKREVGNSQSWSAFISFYTLSQEQQQKLDEVLRKSLTSRMFLCSYSGYNFSLTFGKLVLTLYAKPEISMPFLGWVIPQDKLVINTQGTIYNPAVTVRYGKMIYDEFERTKLFDGMQDLIDKVENYIK